ncbi:hypothetical protein [Sphingomonas insulae]|nr:hypothetical protein [Sphingomonas insulae]
MPAMIALAILFAVPGAPYPAGSNAKDQEAHYQELWAEKISPFSERRKVGQWRIPVFSELHQAIGARKSKPSDLAKERSIRRAFMVSGLDRITLDHLRISCRMELCEYVMIFSARLSGNQRNQALDAINKGVQASCPTSRCQAAAIVGGNGSKGRLSTLGYLIPMDSGFI